MVAPYLFPVALVLDVLALLLKVAAMPSVMREPSLSLYGGEFPPFSWPRVAVADERWLPSSPREP